jgi:hypothetical protein
MKTNDLLSAANFLQVERYWYRILPSNFSNKSVSTIRCKTYSDLIPQTDTHSGSTDNVRAWVDGEEFVVKRNAQKEGWREKQTAYYEGTSNIFRTEATGHAHDTK